jgi:hypothetical protein
MSPRFDLFGNEWTPPDPEDTLIDDQLEAMLGGGGDTITDIVRAETQQGPPPARGRPWERYYDACPYCQHPDSAGVNVATGEFKCHACKTYRTTQWQASRFFAPQIKDAVEFVVHRYNTWVDKAELFQRGRELVNGYAYGPVGGKYDSGNLANWIEELRTEEAVRGRVYSVLRWDLFDYMGTVLTKHDQEQAAIKGLIRRDSKRMVWEAKAEPDAPLSDEHGEVGPSGAKPRRTRRGMAEDDPVGNIAVLGEAGGLPWAHDHYRDGTDPADNCHECHVWDRIKCSCEINLRNSVMLRVSVPTESELSGGVGKYASGLSRNRVAGLQVDPATQVRLWERNRKRRQRARNKGALPENRNRGATGHGARWYGRELGTLNGRIAGDAPAVLTQAKEAAMRAMKGRWMDDVSTD